MNNLPALKKILLETAKALGPKYCKEMTFVGGCTTGLLLTDEFTKEEVRYTNDVDLIVSVLSYVDYMSLTNKLKDHGFKSTIPEQGENRPICALMLGDLRVDFMPDRDFLGFYNLWYVDAMKTATEYPLDADTVIRLISPVYFIATKLEAYKGRGNNDPLWSKDIEDILHLIDGREELIEEIKIADDSVRLYIAYELARLLENKHFNYAVESQAQGNSDREEIILERIEKLLIANHNDSENR
ncbi:MAG: putative nucleotidyltransferase [Enterobacterales bacterium]|jgi:predicted nucleotidyltransferase